MKPLEILLLLSITMQAIRYLEDNLNRVQHAHGIYLNLSGSVTEVMELSDLLRAELVQLVSAVDHFVHELVLEGMLETFGGLRTPTQQFGGFKISVSAIVDRSPTESFSKFEYEIRRHHGYKSFQRPDKIAEAVRLISTAELWNETAKNMQMDPSKVKQKLSLLVDRRDKIVHEADVDPSYPAELWPITVSDVEESISFVDEVGHSIHELVKL